MKRLLTPLSLIVGLYACKNNSNYIQPQTKELITSVYASSKILANNQYIQRAEVTGKLIEYKVKEGDVVRKGDIIAIIENTNSSLNELNAESQLKNALNSTKQLEELSFQVKSLENQRDFDSQNYEKQKSLFEQGVGSKLQLETAQLKFTASENSLKAVKQKFKLLESQTTMNINLAKNNRLLAKKIDENFTLRSSINGKVYSLPSKIGELISPQQVFAVLGDVEKFIVEMEIDESDITRIKVGQEVVVKMDAFSNTYNAKITKILPAMDEKTQTFKVEAEFTTPTPTLYPGLTAESNIIISKRDQVLTIPLTYLLEGDFVETDKGKIKVEVGAKNMTIAEIKSGVTEKSRIKRPE
jgi:multidrug efflux pump subunit AcrA (membrane-fusion protein)